MRGFFDPGELPSDRTLHWPENTDVATRKDPYENLLEILTKCRPIGGSGWYQLGTFDVFIATLFIRHEIV